MEQIKIEGNEKRFIYLIREGDIQFYMLIPNCRKVNLLFSIFEHPTNEQVQSMELVLDKVVLVPVVAEQIMTGIKKNQEIYFEYLDKIVSLVINLAYKILTHNHIEIDSLIYYHHAPEYAMFYEWFQKKYQDRVAPISVVGQTKSVNLEEQNDSLKVQSTDLEQSPPKVEKKSSEKIENGAGFVSYVLLGVLVAVVSLVFLYLII